MPPSLPFLSVSLLSTCFVLSSLDKEGSELRARPPMCVISQCLEGPIEASRAWRHCSPFLPFSPLSGVVFSSSLCAFTLAGAFATVESPYPFQSGLYHDSSLQCMPGERRIFCLSYCRTRTLPPIFPARCWPSRQTAGWCECGYARPSSSFCVVTVCFARVSLIHMYLYMQYVVRTCA